MKEKVLKCVKNNKVDWKKLYELYEKYLLENYVSEDLKKQLKINRETAKFEFKNG